MICDLCGKDSAEFFKARIEGSELTLCSSCSKHGTVLRKVSSAPIVRKDVKKELKNNSKNTSNSTSSSNKISSVLMEKKIVRAIAEDFSKRIRDKRQRMGLNQEDFAKRLSIKESLLHNIEIGKSVPSTELADRLERILGIKLIEETEEIVSEKQSPNNSSSLTVGDMVKIRSRKA